MVFGEYVVGYLFLAGASSGAFLVAACACLWDAWRRSASSERLALSVQPGFFIAPCGIVLALLLLAVDLGRIERVWELMLTPFESIMSVGAWLLALFLAVSGVLAAFGVVHDEVPRWVTGPCCVVGSVLALGVMGYTGVLLSSMVAVDFWNSPWLVALFVASSLTCGTALVVFADALRLSSGRIGVVRGIWHVQLALSIVEAAVLVVFMLLQCGYTEVSQESCRMILAGSLAPIFWVGVVGAGFVVPWAAHAAPSSARQPSLLLIASIGALLGGLLLRYCIVAAALYSPMAL